MGLSMSGTRSDHRKIYVDSGAAEAGANGFADTPFATVEDALATANATPANFDPDIPAHVAAILNTMPYIEVSGVHQSVVIDRSCIVDFKGIVNDLVIAAPIVFVKAIGCTDLEANGATLLRLEGDFNEVILTDCVARLQNAFIDEMTLEGEGALTVVNSCFKGELTVPAEYTATAINSAFSGVTGTIALINSDDGEGS